MMKKLLLVALVPLLVLGFMGCGGIEEGEPLPYFAQGAYKGVIQDINDNIRFVITPTQLTVLRTDNTDETTVGTSAFRTGYEGTLAADGSNGIDDGTLVLYSFDGGEAATLRFAFFAEGKYLEVTEVWYDERLVQTYQLPVPGTYKRSDLD